ncbi:MAG: oligosaccharide flippase family protein, partial [Clostridia bacterium]|nr:oligosaccharide flippase family protein [Clostridia bacterium]
MSGSSLKSKVAKGAVWILMERLSTQGVSFVVGMILARLLTPTDYGTVALTGIFFAVAGVLVNAGFGGALIQKKNADDLDFNTVFYLQLVLATIAYIAMFFAAPWIADFYDTPVLKPIVRVSAICFFYNAINSIQSAELTKKMLFHLSFRISLITCATSAVCGVSFAFLGFGVWTFVWTQVIAG